MSNENQQPSRSPYEDPQLLAKSRGDDRYLDRLVAEKLAVTRLANSEVSATNEEFAAALQNHSRMAHALIAYELEHGYIDIPDSPEHP